MLAKGLAGPRLDDGRDCRLADALDRAEAEADCLRSAARPLDGEGHVAVVHVGRGAPRS